MDVRKGTVTEYRRGTVLLTHVRWEDGHEEVEIHECRPTLLYRSIEPRSLTEALGMMDQLDRSRVLSAIPAVRSLLLGEEGSESPNPSQSEGLSLVPGVKLRSHEYETQRADRMGIIKGSPSPSESDENETKRIDRIETSEGPSNPDKNG